mmetsp:Transcript_14182/g.38994  ORF Transcript_14182/g.38994 Transcript_14182/m.38994 type:complete len:212 (-) Transcript_14182:76-711(-)
MEWCRHSPSSMHSPQPSIPRSVKAPSRSNSSAHSALIGENAFWIKMKSTSEAPSWSKLSPRRMTPRAQHSDPTVFPVRRSSSWPVVAAGRRRGSRRVSPDRVRTLTMTSARRSAVAGAGTAPKVRAERSSVAVETEFDLDRDLELSLARCLAVRLSAARSFTSQGASSCNPETFRSSMGSSAACNPAGGVAPTSTFSTTASGDQITVEQKG